MLSSGFWRELPLDENECHLLTLLAEAHYASAFRDNVSHSVFLGAASGSNDILQAIAAAICSTGGLHAPLRETYAFLNALDIATAAELAMADGRRIPGWGNSFEKGAPDPIWKMVETWMKIFRADWWDGRVEVVTDILHDKGKMIFPNPSCYTAAAAMALGMPCALAPILFLPGRIDGWGKLYSDNHHLWATSF